MPTRCSDVGENVLGKLNAYPAKLIHLNFPPLKVVSRYLDPQPRVVETYSCLFNLRTNKS